MDFFQVVTDLVRTKLGEVARRSAVEGVLRAFGWSTGATIKAGDLDGVPARLFFWETPLGGITLCLPKTGEPIVCPSLHIVSGEPGRFSRITPTAPPRPEMKNLGARQAQDPEFLAKCAAGRERARMLGQRLGPPLKVQIDLAAADRFLRQGHGIKSAAKLLGVSAATLRRHLIDAGMWPPSTQDRK